MVSADLLDTRLLIVSGKGGVGKTTVATALARAAARSGRRTVLAEVEGRGGIARLLGLPAVGFDERPTPFGFAVTSITPREALVEYLWMFFGMRTLSRTLGRAKVLEIWERFRPFTEWEGLRPYVGDPESGPDPQLTLF